MITLYQVEWCPYCHIVRQVMTELGLTYVTVNVPARREERAELFPVTDQAAVHGLLVAVRDLGLSVISIQVVAQDYAASDEPPTGPAPAVVTALGGSAGCGGR